MEICIFKKHWSVPVAQAATDKDNTEAYITFSLVVNRYWGFVFKTSVMNKSFCYRNPFKSLLVALESESTGMAKYDRLKERLRDSGKWGSL